MQIGVMGDSHHVIISRSLIHEFQARDSAPTLHFLGGYIGLKCGSSHNYLLPRVESLYQKGAFDHIDRLILFVGTNDVGDDMPSCIDALENVRNLMPRLLIVGPTQDQCDGFYSEMLIRGFDYIDMRSYPRPMNDVHLTDEGYGLLARDIFTQVVMP